ncbi:MAG: CRISPR-associated protein Cas7 [Bacteroidetes bacterium]|nr:CRISPR-associated protein Cas7 [Bacteroidota bacterium]
MENKKVSPYLYIRGLRHVDHTVFTVANGQKTYWDPQFDTEMSYSSGQQVKRSILDKLTELLGTGRAPVEFQYKIKTEGKTKTIGEDIAVLSTHPKYVDELLGGYMLAEGKGTKKGEEEKEDAAGVVKRRSPLSISAMRPLHPLLANTAKEASITFDRTGNANSTVSLLDEEGKKMNAEEMINKLEEMDTVLRKAKYVDARNQRRAYGLYIYDVAIDLRRLFSVSTDVADPELKRSVLEELRKEGWVEGRNVFGPCITAPKAKRAEIIAALAEALLEWHITSNQARTYSPMETLALSIGTRAHSVTAALRARLKDDGGEKLKAEPVIDLQTGDDTAVFVTLHAEERITRANGHVHALNEARTKLIELLSAYPYEGGA